MKIFECGGFQIVLLPDHDLMLVLSPVCIEFKCLKCFNLRDVYMFDGNQNVPWMKTCTCKKHNYDTVPLSPDMLPADVQSGMQPFDLPADVLPAHTARAVFRFVERDEA